MRNGHEKLCAMDFYAVCETDSFRVTAILVARISMEYLHTEQIVFLNATDSGCLPGRITKGRLYVLLSDQQQQFREPGERAITKIKS
jgi:hypothetical protein